MKTNECEVPQKMKGSETQMTGFMEGADKRYVIPVYQRKYDWRLDNCRQLYSDLRQYRIKPA